MTQTVWCRVLIWPSIIKTLNFLYLPLIVSHFRIAAMLFTLMTGLYLHVWVLSLFCSMHCISTQLYMFLSSHAHLHVPRWIWRNWGSWIMVSWSQASWQTVLMTNWSYSFLTRYLNAAFLTSKIHHFSPTPTNVLTCKEYLSAITQSVSHICSSYNTLMNLQLTAASLRML